MLKRMCIAGIDLQIAIHWEKASTLKARSRLKALRTPGTSEKKRESTSVRSQNGLMRGTDDRFRTRIELKNSEKHVDSAHDQACLTRQASSPPSPSKIGHIPAQTRATPSTDGHVKQKPLAVPLAPLSSGAANYSRACASLVSGETGIEHRPWRQNTPQRDKLKAA